MRFTMPVCEKHERNIQTKLTDVFDSMCFTMPVKSTRKEQARFSLLPCLIDTFTCLHTQQDKQGVTMAWTLSHPFSFAAGYREGLHALSPDKIIDKHRCSHPPSSTKFTGGSCFMMGTLSITSPPPSGRAPRLNTCMCECVCVCWVCVCVCVCVRT